MAATWQSQTSLPRGTRPNIKKLSPALTGTIKLGTVGGSITYGYDVYNDSYRLNLYNLLTTRGGLTISMIGPRTNGTAPATATHGLNGSSVKDFGPGNVNDLLTAPNNLATYAPDVLIIEPIVNTAASDAETTSWRTDCVASITAWASAVPAMRMVIMGTFDAGNDARRTRIATIAGVWSSMLSDLDAAGLSSRYVPITRLSINKNMDQTYNEAMNDRVHWNDRGQLKVADDLFPAVMNACGYDAVW